MSGIPLSYWTGMGAAMPSGRADPAACERLRNAVEQYGLWSKQPDSSEVIAQRAKYRKEWDNLKAQRACRPAPAAPTPTPAPAAPAPAPRPADGPGRVQVATAPAPTPTRTLLPSYTIPQRGPFGFKSNLEPLSQVFFAPPQGAPQQPAMSIRGVPTWVLAAAGAVVALVVGTAIARRLG